MKEAPQITIIVPLFNEQEVFPLLRERLTALLNRMKLPIEVLLINDGSSDRTWELVAETAGQDTRFVGIDLSRNFGHQLAVTAGMSYAHATEAVMVIDGDLQDPPEVLPSFYEYYKQGYEVVYAVRKKRKESFIKRFLYRIYYRLLRKIAHIDLPIDSGDFSLISRKVVDIINQMPESNRYIRGLRAWVGFKHIGVEYERDERQGGKSKYSIGKLLQLAYAGIFNFSEFPIKAISFVGFISIIASIVYFLFVLYKKLFLGTVPEGFTALLFLIIFFFGVQFLAIGILGEYVLRIFFQIKSRPLYIVREIIGREDEPLKSVK